MERCFSGGAAERTIGESRRIPSSRALYPFERGRNGRDGRRVARLCSRQAGTALSPWTATPATDPLIEGIDRQSAEELGVEVGGFLGHDFAGEGNVADLRDAAGIHQENNIGARAGFQVRQGLGGIAHVRDVLLMANGFFAEV